MRDSIYPFKDLKNVYMYIYFRSPPGWILWISLAIMLGDSLTSLSLLVGTSVASALSSRRAPGLHAACACNSCARSCANL